MFDFLIEGFGVALTPLNLGLALLGALLGTLTVHCKKTRLDTLVTLGSLRTSGS